jgi:WNK lysine deficient protein kinase
MEPSEIRGATTESMVEHGTDVGCVDDSCCTNDRDVKKTELSQHVEAGSNSTVDDMETNYMSGTFLDGTMMIGGDPTTILSSKGRENGSVISAMTDLNSLEGRTVPSLLGEEETASQRSDVDLAESGGRENDAENDNNDSGIPKQVILPQDETAISFAPHDDDDVGDHNVNCSSPTAPSETCSSPSSIPNGKTLQQHPPGSSDVNKVNSRHLREFSDQSINDATATTAPSTLIPQPSKDIITPSTTANQLQDERGAAPMEDELVDDDKYDDNNIALDDYIRSPEVQNAIVERSPGGRYVRFMEKLGSGASKDVYRAYDTQEGIEVAWNVVNLSGVPKAERNRIVNEVRLLERLHHQNIISFHGSWVNRERQEVNFVTEILSSGTLKSFINKVQVIRWKIAKRWAFQILKGLEYLHSQDPPVIHRDLKCENIFINGTSGDLRIGDLGLSTVHRNGKVLSVLGTPEFMAPDMYEENSYNEKVDVYAFGMCLLEIFTKEIPYSECSNPAQIYRKVIAGEPPEVLSRLQSRHAREFVLLCLGYRDENGNFIRPTVSELLQHPFLEKRANDDDEVVVDLPPRYAPQDSLSEPTSNATPTVKRRVSTHSSQTLHHHNNSTNGEMTHSRESSLQSESIPVIPNDVTPKQSRSNSVKQIVASSPEEDEEDGDRFEEMQESEISMRKVKVLMGRGQELKEDDEVPSVEVPKDAGKPPQGTNGSSNDIMPSMDFDAVTQATIPSSQEDEQQFSGNSQEAPVPFQYLVNAAVVENENPNIRPYIDDILKLVVTLPVDGQTQNVQFDFHLIEDDPVQVAKEMVKELGIPQAAVLEISETISGLARSARMKQDKHAARLQSLPTSMIPSQVPPVVPNTQVQSQSHQPGLQTETIQYAQDQQEQQLPNVQTVQSIVSLHQHVAQQAPATVPAQQQDVLKYQGAQHAVIQQSMQTSTIPMHQPTVAQDVHVDGNIGQIPQHASDAIAPLPHHPVAPIMNDQQYFQQQSNVPHSQQVQLQPAPVSYTVPEPMQYQSQPNSHQVRATDQANYYPQDLPIHHQQQQPQLAGPLKDVSHSIPQVKSDLVPPIGRPPMQIRQRSGDSDKSSDSRGNVADSDVSTQQHLNHAPHKSAQPQMVLHPTEPHTNVNDPQSTQAFHSMAAAQSNALQYKDAEIVPVISNRSDFPGEALYESQLQRPYGAVVAPNVDGQSTQSEGDSDDEDDVDVADELRKLDEDFQKNLERAKKVFVNRMDNLQRSQIEREAQHLKTLEKHEKEKAEFEKRLAQETEQQQRRIEQLQREWDKKRETIAIQKKKQKDAPMSLNNSDPHSEMTLGHLRTISATSSNFSLSPAMSVHKHQESNGDKTQAIER